MASLSISRAGFCSVPGLGPALCRWSRLAPVEACARGRWARVRCRAEDGDKDLNGEEPPESLFMKELKRRGMNPTSLLEDTKGRLSETNETEIKMQDDGSSLSNKKGTVSTNTGNNASNQRDRSMALNSEGLEGLIPRAKLLLTVGGTFFLGFSPLILVTLAFFVALYFYFGSSFVHDASNAPISPPTYIDPYVLLEEERLLQSALKFPVCTSNITRML